jgi:nucleotide-binding universal stress UspA family protein
VADKPIPAFRRAVVALNGGPSDERILRVVIDLAKPVHAEVVVVHVVEIDWTLPLDANVAGSSEEAQRVLAIAADRVAAEGGGKTVEGLRDQVDDGDLVAGGVHEARHGGAHTTTTDDDDSYQRSSSGIGSRATQTAHGAFFRT